MKVYKFDPNSYAEYWIVAAESPEEALQLVKNRIKSGDGEYCYGLSIQKAWVNATVDKLPPGYSIVTYELGDVIEGEYS